MLVIVIEKICKKFSCWNELETAEQLFFYEMGISRTVHGCVIGNEFKHGKSILRIGWKTNFCIQKWLPDNTPITPPLWASYHRLPVVTTDFLWSCRVGGGKEKLWGVAFIQNGHGFPTVLSQVHSLSFLHKRHDYFVTCCFHAEMSWKQQNTFSFMKWGYHALYTDVS